MPLSTAQPDALANVYARSLFELAESSGGRETIERCLGELEEIVELARSDAKFAEFLSSRALPAAKRAGSIERIFKGRASDLVVRFLMVLNNKERLANLPGIVEAFDAIVQARFGRVEVDVFTAEPLHADQIGMIKDRLSRTMNKETVVHAYTEPAMIGGVKLRIGDQLIDGSIATRLRGIKDQLAGQGLAAMRAKMDRMLGQ